jgi:hypothetical protein
MSILSPGVHGANWSLAGVRMFERRVVRGSESAVHATCGAAIRRVRSGPERTRDRGDKSVTEYSVL